MSCRRPAFFAIAGQLRYHANFICKSHNRDLVLRTLDVYKAQGCRLYDVDFVLDRPGKIKEQENDIASIYSTRIIHMGFGARLKVAQDEAVVLKIPNFSGEDPNGKIAEA